MKVPRKGLHGAWMRVGWLVMGAILHGCSVAHWVRPIGKGNHAITVSAGGPIAGVGEPSLWVPETTVTYKYGASENTDLFVGWHVLETFLNNGNVFVDVGVSHQLLKQSGAVPSISAALILSPLFNAEASWFMIDLPVAASWMVDAKERHLLYVGFHNTFTPVRGSVVPTDVYTWSPFLGYRAHLLRKRTFHLGAEVKWLRPYANTDRSVAGYLAPGDQGALSFLLQIGGVL